MAPDTDTPPAPGAAATYPWRPGAGTLAPIVAVGATFVWVAIGDDLGVGARTAVLAGALAAHAVTLVLGRRRAVLPLTAALVLVGVALVAAVALPLHRSRDVYLYDIYGRMVVVHERNPFEEPPSSVAGDPVLDDVSDDWYEQRSLYGPAFVGGATLVAAIAGDSPLTVRLAWQVVAAGAAGAAVALVARRTRDPSVVLALGCSPVVLAAVNDGHNDVVVGLAVLGAVLLAVDDRPVGAGVASAAALGTKLIAAVPLAGLGLWVLLRRGAGAAARLAAPALGLLAVGYLLAGGAVALEPLRRDSGDDSRYALWQPLRHRLFESLRADGTTFRAALDEVRGQIAVLAAVALVVCLLVVAWRYRRADRAEEVVVATGLAYLLVATYVVPWYPAALIPVAALVWRSRAAVLLWVQSGLLLLAYAEPPGTDATTAIGRWLEDGGATWVGAVLLVALLVWCRPSDDRPPVRAPVAPPVSSAPT